MFSGGMGLHNYAGHRIWYCHVSSFFSKAGPRGTSQFSNGCDVFGRACTEIDKFPSFSRLKRIQICLIRSPTSQSVGFQLPTHAPHYWGQHFLEGHSLSPPAEVGPVAQKMEVKRLRPQKKTYILPYIFFGNPRLALKDLCKAL